MFNSKIPTNLKHKPIFVLDEDYASIDGNYKNNTDVIGLSLGKAQWTSKDEFIPSVKVWRRKNNRWSRQSEETTLTRTLDLATLIIKTVDSFENNRDIEPIRTLHGSLKIKEVSNNDYLKECLKEYLGQQDNINDIKAHIDVLYDALKLYKK
mgnify:CR=1 FL=1